MRKSFMAADCLHRECPDTPVVAFGLHQQSLFSLIIANTAAHALWATSWHPAAQWVHWNLAGAGAASLDVSASSLYVRPVWFRSWLGTYRCNRLSPGSPISDAPVPPDMLNGTALRAGVTFALPPKGTANKGKEMALTAAPDSVTGWPRMMSIRSNSCWRPLRGCGGGWRLCWRPRPAGAMPAAPCILPRPTCFARGWPAPHHRTCWQGQCSW